MSLINASLKRHFSLLFWKKVWSGLSSSPHVVYYLKNSTPFRKCFEFGQNNAVPNIVPEKQTNDQLLTHLRTYLLRVCSFSLIYSSVLMKSISLFYRYFATVSVKMKSLLRSLASASVRHFNMLLRQWRLFFASIWKSAIGFCTFYCYSI